MKNYNYLNSYILVFLPDQVKINLHLIFWVALALSIIIRNHCLCSIKSSYHYFLCCDPQKILGRCLIPSHFLKSHLRLCQCQTYNLHCQNLNQSPYFFTPFSSCQSGPSQRVQQRIQTTVRSPKNYQPGRLNSTSSWDTDWSNIVV